MSTPSPGVAEDGFGTTVKEALAVAAAECPTGARLSTAAILSALVRVDPAADWERVWLCTGAWDFPGSGWSIPDPSPGAATVRWPGLPTLTAEAGQALARLRVMPAAFDMRPVPPGALALALVCDPAAGATRALLASGDVSHEELLALFQSELLGTRLGGFDEFLADTRAMVGAPRAAPGPTLDELRRHVLEFVTLPGMRNIRQLAERHGSALLGPVAEAAVQEGLEIARRSDDPEYVAAAERRGRLLRRIGEVGVDEALRDATWPDGLEDEPAVTEELRELASLLLEFVRARSWPESRQVLLKHQAVLLSDEADVALGALIDGAEADAEDDDVVRMLRTHRILLRRCRKIGIDAAFAEIDSASSEHARPELSDPVVQVAMQFVGVPHLGDARTLVEDYPELLGPAAAAAVDLLLREAKGQAVPEAVRVIGLRRHILRRCREVGIDAAFAEAERQVETAGGGGPEPGGGVTAQDRARGVAIMQFVGAATTDDARRVVETHPVLLTDRVQVSLDRLAAEAPAATAAMLRRKRVLLRRCAEIGIEAAFAELDDAEYEKAEEQPDTDDLVRMFLLAPTLTEARGLVGRWPQLATPDVVARVSAVAAAIQRDLPAPAVEGIQARLVMLRDLAAGGSAAADLDPLVDVMRRIAGDGEGGALAELLQAEPDVLAMDADELDRRLAVARSVGNTAVITALEQVRSLVADDGSQRRSLRIGGIDLALVAPVLEFVATDSWSEAHRFAAAHPELLGEAADQVFGLLVAHADGAGEDRLAEMLATHRRVLARSRECGLAAAFAEVGSAAAGAEPVPEVLGRVREACAEIAERDAPAELRVGLLGQAAQMFESQHRDTGALDALDAAVECWELAFDAATTGAVHAGTVARNLADALVERSAVGDNVADLTRACDVLERASGLPQADATEQAGLLTSLGNALSDLAAHEPARLDEAVAAYEAAISVAGDDPRHRAGLLANLAEGMRRRFDRDRVAADLDASIDALRRSVAAGGGPGALMADVADNLAVSLIERYDRVGDRADLDEAMTVHREHDPWVGDWARLRGYARTLTRLSTLDGRPELLDEAERACREAARLAPDAERMATSLAGVAEVHRGRLHVARNPDSLDAAVAVLGDAVAVAPRGAVRAGIRSVLADALADRFEVLGRPADLDVAIEQDGLSLLDLPPDSPSWADVASSIGQRHLGRATFTEGTADLDAAVEWSERALRTPGARPTERAIHRAQLGIALRERYEAIGDPRDLERSLDAHAAAVVAAGETGDNSAEHLVAWGQALLAHYRKHGDTADIDLAVEVLRRAAAIGAARPTTAEQARAILASALRVRAANSPDRTDLHEAVALGEAAVADPTRHAPRRYERLAALANALDDRYSRDKEPGDLDRAIQLDREALRLAPNGWRPRATVSSALADMLATRGSPTDLEESVDLSIAALDAIDDRSPAKPAAHAVLAAALRRRGRAGDAAKAARHYRLCCTRATQTDPRSVLAVAHQWGRWAAERASWPEAAEAYGYGASALRALVGRQVSRRDKLGWLLGTRTITAGLAHARAATGDVEGAVAAAEGGRALLLAEKLGISPAGRTPEFADVARAAGTATVCYLFAADHAGVALVVTPDGTARHRMLGDLTGAELRTHAVRFAAALAELRSGASPAAWNCALDDLGQWLWTAAAGPLLDLLPADTADIVLIPGGLLGILPLHAACILDPDAPTGRRYLIDSVRVSYAASAAAHAAARTAAATPADSVLVVEEPAGTGCVPMPTAGVEAEHVARVFAGSQPLRASADAVLHLRGEEATRRAVLDAAGDYAVLYLCCHAFADNAEPLDSALVMVDGEHLTVADLMRRRHRPGRLAVLSACESAVQGAEIPDEVIGFPTGLAQAGFAGVIGAQWPIPDRAASAIMQTFITLWREDGLPPAEALRRAQQRLRDRSPAPRPDGWAALTFTGA